MAYGAMVPDSLPAFEDVVEKVRSGHPEGLDQLYTVFRIFSISLRRQVGFCDFEDRMHDIFLVVVEAIREGKLREPAALPSYIHGIARLSLCSNIGVRVRRNRLSGALRHWVSTRQRTTTPEELLAQRERVEVLRRLLGSLSTKEREILTRFYIHEQTKEQICEDLNLTDTQFRLAKSRAKQRLTRMGQHGCATAACAA
jgi:RNA polymerase sigma factor (sigma-70 family)